MTRGTRTAAVLAAGSVGLAGCGFTGLYDVQLPGGPDVGGHPYHVVVQFGDVLDLVPQSAVRVNDVPVGKVEKIVLEDWHARVTMLVNGDVRLPANAIATIRQSSLLGEKFVALGPPTSVPAQGTLGDGDVIPLARSGRNPEVEEVLSALSLILNGGGLAQLQTINRELGNALDGREGAVRGLLSQLDTFVGGLDEQKADITRALDSLDRLSATLARQRTVIGTTLDTLPGALKVLADQRGQLTQMLTGLSRFGGVASSVIEQSKDDLIADLKALAPTLQQLVNAGTNLPNGLEILLTFPFPDVSEQAIKGDYVNLYATLNLNLQDILHTLLPSLVPKLPIVPVDIPGVTAPTPRPTGGQSGGQRPPADQPPPTTLPVVPGAPEQNDLPAPTQSGSGLPDVIGGLLGGLL